MSRETAGREQVGEGRARHSEPHSRESAAHLH